MSPAWRARGPLPVVLGAAALVAVAGIVSVSRLTGSAPLRAGMAAPKTVKLASVAHRVQYSFDDEFTGRAGANPNAGLSKAYWSSDPCWTSGCGTPPEPTRYAAANAHLDGHGHLVLTAVDGASGRCGAVACRFTSARLTMLHWAYPFNGLPTWSQRYGTFSARIEAPGGTGLAPAVWLVGSDLPSAGWPVAGELDLVDGVGSPRVVEQQAEFGTSSALLTDKGASALPARQLLTGWHTYTVKWSPSGVKWLIDGKSSFSMSAGSAGEYWARTFEHPFSFVLDLAVDGSMTPAEADKLLPARMLVDWVRVTTRS